MAIVVNGIDTTEIEAKLTDNLSNLADWFMCNKLSLNLDKCKVMVFGNRHPQGRISNVHVQYENTVLEQVQSFKYLGIVLDSTLSFNEHIHYLKGKLYTKIILLGRVRGLLDIYTSLMVYKTLILPVIDYCAYIYLGTMAQNRETLQKLQNCAFRSILCSTPEVKNMLQYKSSNT